MQRFYRVFICLLIFGHMQVNAMLIVESKSWNSQWRGKGQLEHDLQGLMNRLSESPIGAQLIKIGNKKASHSGKRLIDFLAVGNTSYTDFTLTRKITAGKTVLTRKGRVYIDENTTVKRAVYDLGHELVHFIWQKGHDPYDHKHNYAGYLKGNIEGKGGEVDAFMMECKIAKELHPGSWGRTYPCRHISKNGKVSRELALSAFYKVGRDASKVVASLGSENANFPYLSSASPVIIAGTRSHPYPTTLLSEFKEIRAQVCQHEKRRLGRSPASSIDRGILASLCSY